MFSSTCTPSVCRMLSAEYPAISVTWVPSAVCT